MTSLTISAQDYNFIQLGQALVIELAKTDKSFRRFLKLNKDYRVLARKLLNLLKLDTTHVLYSAALKFRSMTYFSNVSHDICFNLIFSTL